MADLQEQMEMLQTNQANSTLPWSPQTLVHDDSETEESTTAEVREMTLLVDPSNLLDTGVEETESTTEEVCDQQILQTQLIVKQ
jgi:hypothetical protein